MKFRKKLIPIIHNTQQHYSFFSFYLIKKMLIMNDELVVDFFENILKFYRLKILNL